MNAYSVQQIKFEFISYVKEFGADFSAWSVGVAEDAAAALFRDHGVDEARDIWLWKPEVSPAAAAMVRDWICGRQGATALVGEGRQVFLFRRGSVVASGVEGTAGTRFASAHDAASG